MTSIFLFCTESDVKSFKTNFTKFCSASLNNLRYSAEITPPKLSNSNNTEKIIGAVDPEPLCSLIKTSAHPALTRVYGISHILAGRGHICTEEFNTTYFRVEGEEADLEKGIILRRVTRIAKNY